MVQTHSLNPVRNEILMNIKWRQMNWSKIEIDHVKPIPSFEISKDDGLRETFNWRKTKALLKEVHQHKSTKKIFLKVAHNLVKLITSSN